MFNFYKYSFLFIMNLSLALKIDSCSYLIMPGIYTLDKVTIDKDYYYNVRIDLRIVANPTHTDNDEYGGFIAYTLEGIIEYFKNNEKYEINILYCADFKSKDESIKESSVTLTNVFIHNKQPLSINILNSNIIHFTPTDDALEKDYQLLNNDLFPQGILESNGIDNYEKLIRDQTDDNPPAKKRRLSTHLEHNAMQLSSELTHKADNSESSIVSQEPLTKNGELTSDKIGEAQSSVSEITSQSSGAEAGTGSQSIGRFNGEVENNGVQESKTILVNKISDLKPIIDNLDKNQSLELNSKSIFSKQVTYTKIIINYDNKKYKGKTYNITVFHNKKGEATYSHIVIIIFMRQNKLKIRFYGNKIIKPINNDSEGEKFKDIELLIENYDLSLLTTLQPDEKLDETKKRENQLVSDLKKQYGENFIYLFMVTPSSNKQMLYDLIHELNDEERLVFFQNDVYSRKVYYNEIEITKNLRTKGVAGVDYYSIHIKYLPDGEETIESTPISVIFNGNYVKLKFVVSSNGMMIKRSVTVNNFHLIRLPNTTS